MILFSGHGDIADSYSKKYECDVLSLRGKSIEELEKLLPAYDVIVHNAANLAPKNIEEATNDNFILTKNILDTLYRVHPNAKFIYLSSMSMLKNEEEYLDPLRMTNYAFSKYLGEIYTLASPIKTAIAIRFSTIFYGNPAKDGLSKLIVDAARQKKITVYNDGSAKRDFIPLEVLVDYLNKICTADTAHNIYNVCAGVSTSFAEVVALLKAKLPDLVVENIVMENTVPVLSDFSSNGLKEFGIAEFDLGSYVNSYLNKLGKG